MPVPEHRELPRQQKKVPDTFSVSQAGTEGGPGRVESSLQGDRRSQSQELDGNYNEREPGRLNVSLDDWTEYLVDPPLTMALLDRALD